MKKIYVKKTLKAIMVNKILERLSAKHQWVMTRGPFQSLRSWPPSPSYDPYGVCMGYDQGYRNLGAGGENQFPSQILDVNLASIKGPYYLHHITSRPLLPRILRPSYGPGLWLVFGSLVRSNKLPKSNSSCSQTQVKTLSGERHLTWLAIAIDSSPWNRAGMKSTGKMALSGHP